MKPAQSNTFPDTDEDAIPMTERASESRLRITYLIEDTDLSGGVRVSLAQADALISRGHEVVIATKGLPLRWRRSNATWLHVDDFSEIDPSDFDFIVGTFWTTVPAAYELGKERAVHLCQGYEGSFTAYQQLRREIDEAYSCPIPKIVVAPSLIPICERFGSEVLCVGQIIDDEFYRDSAAAENDPLRVLLVGASQVDFKGIDVGYGAAANARYRGAEFGLVRVSPWRPSGEEPVEEIAAEFHVGLDAPAMARLVHSCDIFLGSSRQQEGFGLPAAEAMASMLPAVLTRIPSFLSFDARQDFALFADEDDAEGLGDCLFTMIESPAERARLRKRGREVAEQFRSEHAGERLEKFFFQRREELTAMADPQGRQNPRI